MHLDMLSPGRILKNHDAVTILAVCDQEPKDGWPYCLTTEEFFSVGIRFSA